MLAWAVGERPGAMGYWNCQAMATHALTGVPAVDQATATSFGGLYDGGRWDTRALDDLGVDEAQLPVVGGMGQGLGTVPDSPTVFAGGSIDAFCEQIVAGANQVGDVLVIFGATLIVWVVTEAWRDVPGLDHPAQHGGRAGHDRRAQQRRRPVRRLGRQTHRTSGPEAGVGLPAGRSRDTPGREVPPRSRCGCPICAASAPRSTTPPSAPASTGWTSPRARSPWSGRPTRPAASSSVASSSGPASPPDGSWPPAAARARCRGCRRSPMPPAFRSTRWRCSEGAALGAAFLARMATGIESSFDGADAWARVGRRIEPDAAWAAAASRRFEQFETLGPAD